MGGIGSAIGNTVGSVFGGLTNGMFDAGGMGNSIAGRMPDIDRQKFAEQLAASQGRFTALQPQQMALAQQLMANAQGQGPNPAQAMLQQQTQNNIRQGAGMIASTKGINPALAARLAANQTGDLNQQAAGQGAIMQAQQQLAAQQGLGNLYGQMAGQELQNQGILQNAQASQNQAITQGSLGAQGISAQGQLANQQARSGLMGGLLQGAGSAATAAILASRGGKIPGEAEVAGDSTKNDTVPAMLSPGEIVIPRSHAGDPESAKAFIDQLMGRRQKMADGGVAGDMSPGQMMAMAQGAGQGFGQMGKTQVPSVAQILGPAEAAGLAAPGMAKGGVVPDEARSKEFIEHLVNEKKKKRSA